MNMLFISNKIIIVVSVVIGGVGILGLVLFIIIILLIINYIIINYIITVGLIIYQKSQNVEARRR
jgi:hypothetical protein